MTIKPKQLVVATSCDATFIAAVDAAARSEFMDRATFMRRALARALREHDASPITHHGASEPVVAGAAR